MGNSSWNPTMYAATSTTYREKDIGELFSSRKTKSEYDPRNITVRESFDSDANPESNAIIVGLDVTGSMGFIAEHIAKHSLGALVESILDRKPVTDPHVMFMAIGDISCDSAPLQVTQFEADIQIATQLTELWLEGGGGGNTYESYDLPWVFAARKTKIDCFTKRNKKGYLFTIGDELPPRTASRGQLNESLGITEQADQTDDYYLREAQVTYNVFHMIIEEGHFASRRIDKVVGDWRELLGRKALRVNDYKCISEIITSVIEVNEGADPDQVIDSWQSKDIQKAVRYTLYNEAE